MKFDLAIIGAGVIGLSTAFEALSRGWSVVLIERTQAVPQASWAGAGILPAANIDTAVDPFDRLRAISDQLHQQWSQQLYEISGIDNELKKCGTIFVAQSAGEIASLRGQERSWLEEKIEFQVCDPAQIKTHLGNANAETRDSIQHAVFVPGEHQLRNPAHLNALQTSCEKLGGKIIHSCATQFEFSSDQLTRIYADDQPVDANHVCFTCGAWTGELLKDVGVEISMEPVRGQILLYQLDQPLFPVILYEGSQYIVSRTDGYVLVGSTLERAGFDNSTTPEAVERLQGFANKWSNRLNEQSFVRSWAGLRPGTHDGMPYIGRLAEFKNVYIATGHLRSGLHLSTGTAKVLNQLMRDEALDVDLDPFRPSRG